MKTLEIKTSVQKQWHRFPTCTGTTGLQPVKQWHRFKTCESTKSGWHWITVIGFALMLFSVTGCNIITPVMWFIEGPPTQPALYTLNPEQDVVVFLDDRGTVIPRSRWRQKLAMTTTQTLLDQPELIRNAITPQAATRVASQEEYGHLIPIDEVGRRVQADVIIYATVDRFDLLDNGYPKPIAQMRVKIVDSQTGRQLWPDDPHGHDLVAQMPTQLNSQYEAGASDALAEVLAEYAGLRLAQLFFEHEPNPFDAEINY